MITAKKRSPNKVFAAGACLPYVATTCTKLHTICDHYDHYLTESTSVQFSKIFLKAHASQTPLDTTCIDFGHTTLKYLAMAWILLDLIRFANFVSSIAGTRMQREGFLATGKLDKFLCYAWILAKKCRLRTVIIVSGDETIFTVVPHAYVTSHIQYAYI